MRKRFPPGKAGILSRPFVGFFGVYGRSNQKALASGDVLENDEAVVFRMNIFFHELYSTKPNVVSVGPSPQMVGSGWNLKHQRVVLLLPNVKLAFVPGATQPTDGRNISRPKQPEAPSPRRGFIFNPRSPRSVTGSRRQSP
jgi:hypothetical protein